MGIKQGEKWPRWWEWDLEFSLHLSERMLDRRISEVDIRGMMSSAMNLRPAFKIGRWIVETRYEGSRWELVVEPDLEEELLVVITAYRVEHR